MRELIDLERGGWQALADGTARDFFGNLLTADAVVVVPGMVLDREQTLASWDGVPPWADYRIYDECVVGLDANTAAVTYRMRASRPGAPPYRAQLTSVYVCQDGRWRLALHQQTPQP